MKVPSITQAHEILREAEMFNPGPWIGHSMIAAKTAQVIAENCALDPQVAYVLGMLHDIGYRDKKAAIAHIFAGYRYMSELGFDDSATICLTHSFPINDTKTFLGKRNCTDNEMEFLQKFLAEREYTDYDKLIQLCDALCMPNGTVIIEKRMVDVALRHGLFDFTLDKWRSYFNLKDYFDDRAKCNIYSLLTIIN